MKIAGYIIACIVGVGGGLLLASLLVVPAPWDSPKGAAIIESPEYKQLQDERDRLLAQVDELRKSREAWTVRESDFAVKITGLQSELKSARATLEAPLAGEEPAISYGDWRKVDGLRKADWKAIAATLKGMDALALELMEALKSGKAIDSSLLQKIGELNKTLVGYAVSLAGKLPTNGTQINGEYTHPASLSNMIAAYLDGEEHPLTEEQRESIARFGEDYDASWNELNAKYSEDTPKLQKSMDELELKLQFMEHLTGQLDSEQTGIYNKGEVRGKQFLDPMSPSLMMAMNISPVMLDSPEKLRGELVKLTAQQIGVDESALSTHPAFDEWAQQLSGQLRPMNQLGILGVSTEQDLLLSGRAQLSALQQLMNDPTLPEEARRKIAGIGNVTMPILNTKSNTAAPGENSEDPAAVDK